MRKVLVRTGLSVFNQYETSEILAQNMMGCNIGNLIFSYSMTRTIMTEDTVVDTMSTYREYSDEEIEFINKEYDYIVMPFANAFRKSYMKELQRATKFVKKLEIPCIIAGIGLQAGINENINKDFVFDDVAKEFVEAVLEKSSKIGVRGEVTASYLKKLGFKEEEDFTVIGCPSMFLHGREFPELRLNELTKDSPVSLNWKIDLPDKIHKFMNKNINLLNDYQYVPQVLDEMRLMYYGVPLSEKTYPKIPKGFPDRMNHDFYANDKAVSFVNIPTWMEYFKRKDIAFGTRIHGNIVSLLAGTPCYIIASDSRVKELADYHNIPNIAYTDIKDDMDIFNLYNNADYSKIYEGYEEKFNHFIDFLDENGIDHIYKDGKDGKNCPFDQQLAKTQFQPELHPFASVSSEEQAVRIKELCDWYNQKRAENTKKHKEEIAEYKNEIKGYKHQLKHNTITKRNVARKIYRKLVPLK